MKKIISIFGLTALLLTSSLFVISCSHDGKKQTDKQDEEITDKDEKTEDKVETPFVPMDFSKNNGTGVLGAKLWFDNTVPTSLEKDADGNMNVGWKDYNIYWKGEKLDSTGTDKKAKFGGKAKSNYTGTITEEVYKNEYSNREQILNRVYNKSTGKYEDSSSKWDLTSLKKEFGIE